jgi:TetR/AcrR family transcriptional regulator, transcriptional repressor for nem operon
MSTTSTKTELLHEASRMLLAKGLKGFSLQELAESLNIKKASLFHHYPSKKALAIELYRFYQTSFLEWVKKYESRTPEKQIVNYAEKLTTWICEKQRVCPVGALSLEWHLVPPELQVEIKKLHELQKSWLMSLVKEMDIRIPDADAVMGIMALIQGSIQLARMNDDPKLVIKNLKSYLKSIKK